MWVGGKVGVSVFGELLLANADVTEMKLYYNLLSCIFVCVCEYGEGKERMSDVKERESETYGWRR